MSLQYEEDNSRMERIRREMRNPSMRTILIGLVVAIIVVSAPFAPKWFSQTQAGIGDLTEEHDLTAASNIPDVDLTDEQIGPWLAEQGETMINATGPLTWKVVNFRFGPCSEEGLSGMAAGDYAESMSQACETLGDIQGRYVRDCFVAATCAVKDEAKAELRTAIDAIWAAHAAAGYVR